MQRSTRGGKNRETSNRAKETQHTKRVQTERVDFGLEEGVHTDSLRCDNKWVPVCVCVCVCICVCEWESTFRSLLSRCSSSEPRMSCRMKVSLYSPRLSCSSQMPTSSVPHLSTVHAHTHVRTRTHTHKNAHTEQSRERLRVPHGYANALPHSTNCHTLTSFNHIYSVNVSSNTHTHNLTNGHRLW